MVTIAYTVIGYTHTAPLLADEHPADTVPALPQALVHAWHEHVVVTV